MSFEYERHPLPERKEPGNLLTFNPGDAVYVSTRYKGKWKNVKLKTKWSSNGDILINVPYYDSMKFDLNATIFDE